MRSERQCIVRICIQIYNYLPFYARVWAYMELPVDKIGGLSPDPLLTPISSLSLCLSFFLSLSLSLSLFLFESRSCVTSTASFFIALTWLTTCVTASRANTIPDPRTSQSHNRPSALLSTTSTCFIAPSTISPTVITLSVFQREIDVIA